MSSPQNRKEEEQKDAQKPQGSGNNAKEIQNESLPKQATAPRISKWEVVLTEDHYIIRERNAKN